MPLEIAEYVTSLFLTKKKGGMVLLIESTASKLLFWLNYRSLLTAQVEPKCKYRKL